MTKEKEIDLVVIGSGPGGYAAAFRASDLGQKVLLIDKDDELGGVCLNRGCIPSKALLHIAKVIDETKHLSKIGVSFSKPQIDLDAVRNHKNKIVSQLNTGIKQLAKVRKVETMQGLASFLSANQILVEGENGTTKIIFKKCIIAAGSSSSLIPGLPKNHPSVLTSKTALDLVDIPESLLVIGGGVIGVELGQVYASLGSAVSVVEFLPGLIPGADKDIVKPLQRKLKKQFSSIMLSSKVISVNANTDKTLTVEIENEKGVETKTYNKVLVSVGRKPNTGLLKVENAEITVNE